MTPWGQIGLNYDEDVLSHGFFFKQGIKLTHFIGFPPLVFKTLSHE